ncbi:hypothetical protein EUGRSUZ_B01118 [Eucalyptus grandis]|uniref:Uncharacterized protein n=2 Tax=Eucalyptus grandis TaxID=71139 RepID=A0ACC3LR61_EUCGR|nr:hypothetical protein EUGRSUZ_B01118 [Eucalyptus grandis]
MVPETPMTSTVNAARPEPFAVEPEALAIILPTPQQTHQEMIHGWMIIASQIRGRGLNKPSYCFSLRRRKTKVPIT